MTEPTNRETLLAARIARAASKATARVIPARTESDPICLTPSQESLWFLHQADPANTAYNVFKCFAFTGSIRADLMTTALQRVVARHESLRTVIADRDGVPIPSIVKTPDDAEVRVVQSKQIIGDDGSIADDVIERCSAFVREPFDLSRTPLIRALVVADAERSVLVISVHHIACDEWSLDIILRELSAFYGALEDGTLPLLQEVSVKFSDYSAWLSDKVTGVERGASQTAPLDYWATVLEGVDTADYLPLPAPDSHERGGELLSGGLDQTTSDRVREMAKDLSRTESVSVFSILVAGFAALLFRYSRRSPIRIGVPVTNRTTAGLDTLVGYLLNTLVLNINVNPAAPFRVFVNETTRAINDALANQDVPFDLLVRSFAEGREGTRNPFFDYMFVMLGAGSGLVLGSLNGVDVELNPGTAKFDLTLFASNPHSSSDPIGLMAEYKTDAFSKVDVDQFCRRYSTILSSAMRNPDEAIDALQIDEDGLGSILTGGARPQGVHSTLSSWVHAAAAANPDATAVTADNTGESLSYLQLLQRAKELSEMMTAAGLGSHQRVAIALDATIDLIPAVLAVWNCDCAFVPIDTSYPSGYLNRILTNVDPALILCTQDTAAIPADYRSRTLIVSGVNRTRSDGEARAHQTRAHADDLAYVIYTSGSTGAPRGVPITHANILYSTEARHEYYRNTPPERFLVLSSSAFDSSMAGIWWTVTSGGEAIFLDAEKRRDVEYVSTVIRDRGVTHSLCTPMLYDALLDYPDHLAKLELVIVAGETCSPALVRRHFEMSSSRLFNEYGPTECTVWASVYECRVHEWTREVGGVRRPDTMSPRETVGIRTKLERQSMGPTDGSLFGDVPIGKPIAGTEFAVIGIDGVQLPTGVVGELAIRSDGVCPGYYSESLSAKFSEGGWYRTGDLGWISGGPAGSGVIHFAGRVDAQVKLNGFRIEPGEIEAVLKLHPGVMDVVVVVPETGQ